MIFDKDDPNNSPWQDSYNSLTPLRKAMREGFTSRDLWDKDLNDDQPLRHPMSQAFHDTLEAMADLHDRKQSDYGRENDPFANVRASEEFGIEGWIGALIRMNDKMRRLQRAAQGSTLVNEGVEDSLIDIAVYSCIALVLFQEQNNGI